jgi:hypothetical protein
LLAGQDITAEQALIAELLSHCDRLLDVGFPGFVLGTLAGAHSEGRQ